jgi:uncharacterized protein YukE
MKSSVFVILHLATAAAYIGVIILSQDILAFDIAKAETSGRKIRTEADKLKRITDKLKRAVNDTPSWWIGSSRNGFTRQANELLEQMYKAVNLVTELGDDMTAIAKAKKEEEARLKSELTGALAIKVGSVEDVKNWKFKDATRDAVIYTSAEGVKFVYPADYSPNANRIDPEKAIELFNQLPDALKNNIKVVTFMDINNPDDYYWETVYGIPGFTSAATGGNGNITFWEPGQHSKSDDSILTTMRHEAAHNLDQAIGGGTRFSETQEWQDIIDADFAVSGQLSPTSYGLTHVREDFAESVAMYLKDPVVFETDFPNRAAYIKEALK